MFGEGSRAEGVLTNNIEEKVSGDRCEEDGTTRKGTCAGEKNVGRRGDA